jgi:hypothetical protein
MRAFQKLKNPMALETASFISQLNAANPSGADRVHQGDDHIRLLKAVLKATFPNITGPVLANQERLNADFTLPIGLIVSWYGSPESVPTGWAICNGQSVLRSDGAGQITLPDLRDRVLIGASGAFPTLSTPGAFSQTVLTGAAGGHTHTVGGGEHTHLVNVQDTATGGSIATTTTRVENEQFQSTVINGVTFTPPPAHRHTATAESATHSHTVSAEGAHSHAVQVSTLQPSFALHFIMKV